MMTYDEKIAFQEEIAEMIVNNAFKDKKDLSGEDYIYHIYRVRDKFDEKETRIIALLHDLLEDCPEWNAQTLSCIFEKRIVDCVSCLTKGKNEDYSIYIDRIIQSNDGWAIAVKKCDLIDNMNIARLTEITDKDVSRIRKYHTAYQKLSKI